MRHVLILITCWLAAACGTANPASHADAGAAKDGSADAVARDDAADADVPETAAARQLAWLIALVNGPAAAITAEAILPHFDAAFLAQVPVEALAQSLREMANQLAPVTVLSTNVLGSGPLVAVLSTRGRMYFRLNTAVQRPSERIGGLLFEPAPELDADLREFASIAERLRALAPRTALSIAALEGGACRPLHELAADTPQPLASLFKIYVLGALVARIESGQSQWTDVLPIRDEWKSLPSGELQDADAGTPVSLRSYAEKMISISDNTAADHLIHLLGREQVEAQQAAMGHRQPALNIPFLTTRDLFVIKLALAVDERRAYLAASVSERRRLLDEVYAGKQPPEDLEQVVAAWTGPHQIDTLEWFASAADVCRAFAALETAGRRTSGAPALQALALNPGLNVDRSTFSYIGYKGGSEPGVLTTAWLLRRKGDDAWRVVTVLTADETKALPELSVLYLALAAVQLAGR